MSAAFRLPDGLVHVAFSGGRTSGYMLARLRDANKPWPEDRVEVVFTNTGREREETLRFVHEVGSRWGVRVTWLEYRPEPPGFEIVGLNSAAREGEPFEALLAKRKYLPNQAQRFCTEMLKVRTARDYLRSLGWEHWTALVGFRADEARRANPRPKERWSNAYPLIAAGITKADVTAFWREQPFDLRLENVRGKTPAGNCDGCFLKSEAYLAGLARDEPERARWWEEMEMEISGLTKSPNGARWSKRHSRRELREFIERQGDWMLSTEGALCQADEGECFA